MYQMKFLSALLLTIALMAVACGPENTSSNTLLAAPMQDAEGSSVGTVTMQEGPTGFLVNVMLSDLSPGWHAIHIHAVGECSPDFKASGGHINVDNKQHGLLNDDGPDNGDLPNIHAATDGTVLAELFTTNVEAAMLKDSDGAAIIVHENADDHMTQPIGGAGGRIACGVLSP